MTSLKSAALAAARAVGFDIIRLGSLRHPIGRRARLMVSLGIDLVIDVGANRGQFGLEVRRAGYGGRMVSIEPLAEPFLELSRSAARDTGWTAIQSAVGPRAGSATIHVAANDGASSSFLPMLDLHARSAPEARFIADERVEMATLDGLVQPRWGSPSAVFTKIDVQGYEMEVLAGGEATLARSTLVQLEMSLLPLYDTAPSYREIVDYLTQHGFCLVGIEPGFASQTGAQLQADGLFATNAAARFLQGVVDL